MRNKKLLLGGLLLLGIGFAAVSTTLYLTGNVTIATNDADFDVKFTKAVLDGTDTPSAIIEDGKKITFGTKDLVTVGDKSILDFEVTNNSEMYDAEVSVSCAAGGEVDKSTYYKITSSVKSPIVAKTTEAGKVEVELLKASAVDLREPFSCTLTAKATERTEKAKEKYRPKYFARGNPTPASTQDYTTLGKNVFVGLDADEIQKSVCIVRNGSLECFKNNNWEEEKDHIIQVFSDIVCSFSPPNNSSVNCTASDFNCDLSSSGSVVCYNSDFAWCSVDSSGVHCG